jgi:quercetin dioxygenase-like cupin family protein
VTGEREADGSPADRGRRYYHPQQKDYATFLQTSEETGGERTLIEIEVAPGGGNDPHFHKTYDEHFEVLEGALEVRTGDETRTLRPGEKAVAPRNTRHNFRNPTGEPSTFLVELRPGLRESPEGWLRPGERRRRPRPPPVLPGGAPRLVGYPAAGRLHRPRTAPAAVGQAGAAQGDRPQLEARYFR